MSPFERNEKMYSQQRNRRQEEKPNGKFGTKEKLNNLNKLNEIIPDILTPFFQLNA